MSTSDIIDHESDVGEVTGQIRSAAEERKRMSDQVKHQKERVGQKLAALRRRLADQQSGVRRPTS